MWACEPGDIVVFHGKTLHGARGNASAVHQRRVLSTRWVGEGTVLAKRPWQVQQMFKKYQFSPLDDSAIICLNLTAVGVSSVAGRPAAGRSLCGGGYISAGLRYTNRRQLGHASKYYSFL